MNGGIGDRKCPVEVRNFRRRSIFLVFENEGQQCLSGVALVGWGRDSRVETENAVEC